MTVKAKLKKRKHDSSENLFFRIINVMCCFDYSKNRLLYLIDLANNNKYLFY